MAQASLVTAPQQRDAEQRLLHAFADVRLELTQTLARFLGSFDDAQDAVQDTFLKCWRSRERVPEVRNLRAWVFRVGLNAARDLQRNVWRRRSRPLTPGAEDSGGTGLSPADEVLHGEDLDRLRVALGGLRAEERAVFLLRQNTGLTYEAIACRCRLPVGTIKTQMRSALHKLRLVLQDRA